MGFLERIVLPLNGLILERGTGVTLVIAAVTIIVVIVVLNVFKQLFLKNPNEPPVVFHWFPIIGSTITYGIDPYKFFSDCRAKYGDIFTFILLGKKTTVYLGVEGNEFILNGKLRDLNAEDVYTVLTTPVFGKDVVYDCPNSKLMEQKKFMKIGLTTEAFRSYVPLITNEVINFTNRCQYFKGKSGRVNIPAVMAEITIYTASRSLQGKEVRERFDSSFAKLYHDLDMGFSAINFMLHWAPLPHNRARDYAQRKMTEVYMEIVKDRRAGCEKKEHDMIWNLMDSTYRGGVPIPDKEIAHMMIALLMAGQHSSSSTSAWIMLRLATCPHIMEELYEEQRRVLGSDLPPLTYDDLAKLPLNQQVIKETLRLHAPIHSIMRAVTTPIPVPGSRYVIPTSHNLLCAPGVTSRVDQYFPNPTVWDPHRWDPDSNGVTMGDIKEEQEDYGYGLISKGAHSPYLPFGAGRHRCIGEQFANLQLGAITATMVRLFKFRMPNGVTDVPPTDYSSLFSRPMAKFSDVLWERREKA